MKLGTIARHGTMKRHPSKRSRHRSHDGANLCGLLGRMLRDAAKQEKYITIADIVRQLALTCCRRSEMIRLKWTEADTEASCLRLEDSKEGESIRPIGLPVVDYLERRRTLNVDTFVFPGQGKGNAFGSFANHWKHLFENSQPSDVTPHVLRHYVASRTMSHTVTEFCNSCRKLQIVRLKGLAKHAT